MVLAHGLCNTTWWFCGTCYYISSHKGSCCISKWRRRSDKWQGEDKKKARVEQERLDRLAKGAFVKVRSMAWDVWIHACSHSLLSGGYDHEVFHGCIAMVFLLNNTWVEEVIRLSRLADWVFLKSAFVKHGMGCVDSCLDTWKCIGGLDVSEVFIVTLGWLIRWSMNAFGGWVFPSMRVSQGISCVTILWVCCLFSCMWILIAYFF